MPFFDLFKNICHFITCYRFFSLLFVYFVGGILFLKFARGAEGIEMIPNYGFWSMLPGLIKASHSFFDKQAGRLTKWQNAI
jgi:hypothetical protein